MCEAIGFEKVRTYIASGNVVFQSGGSEDQVRSGIEGQLQAHTDRSVGVIVRAAAKIAAPNNRVMALFIDGPLPSDPLDGVTGIKSDQIRLEKREMFVLYPDGMSNIRLRLPSEKHAARNMNTVLKLARMAAATAQSGNGQMTERPAALS